VCESPPVTIILFGVLFIILLQSANRHFHYVIFSYRQLLYQSVILFITLFVLVYVNCIYLATGPPVCASQSVSYFKLLVITYIIIFCSRTKRVTRIILSAAQLLACHINWLHLFCWAKRPIYHILFCNWCKLFKIYISKHLHTIYITYLSLFLSTHTHAHLHTGCVVRTPTYRRRWQEWMMGSCNNY